MATHAGVALELGITRPSSSGLKMMSPQMEAILIWCQCRVREYKGVKIENFTESWKSGVAFCALIHNFFPQSFDFSKINPENRRQNYEIAFKTGERYAGLPDCRGHGRHGQRLQSRPQNDLLLRPRGLPDVQRDVESSFHTTSSAVVSFHLTHSHVLLKMH